MKKLLKYLSPFAPDQSGACGVLYELGGLIVICDAGGCAGNICGFDEPRWFTKRSAVFSAGLRDMDAIMGRDDKLIAKLADAQKSLNCNFTAIVATPVPAVIATDMKALKRMAEKKTGVPCITVNAIGTRYYDEGESEAWLQLFREFAGTTAEDEIPSESAEADTVGVIGATPLETGYSSAAPLKEGLRRYGVEDSVIYGVGTDLDAVRAAGSVKKNLVVSAAGIRAAEYLKEKFGTPYEVGYPFIPESVSSEVKAAVETDSLGKTLIIGSQFASNELRDFIGDGSKVNCATFFMSDNNYAAEGDIRLSGEDELAELVEEGKYNTIIADDDIKRFLDAVGYEGRFISFPHFAISGRPLDDGKTLYN